MPAFEPDMSSPDFIHVINFGRRLAVNAVFILVPLHLLNLGFSGWQIGAAGSLFAFAPLLFAFPIGWANDRFAIKEIIRAALALLSALLVVLGRVRGFLPMALVFLLLGVGNNALDVSINSFYYKNGQDANPNKKYSRLVFWSALGTALGPGLAGLVLSSSGYPAMFMALAVFLILLQVFVGPLTRVPFSFVPLRAYRGDLFRRNTILFSVLIFVIGLHWGVEGTVYSPFLKTVLHLSTLSASLYISLALLGVALSAWLIGRIKFDLLLNKRIFILSMILSGAGLALMVIPSLPVSFGFRVMHEIGDGFLGALVVLFISRLFEKESIGGSSGLLITVMTTGQMVGALVFSSMGFRFGLAYPFIVSGSLLVANGGLARFCFRRAEY
jgi:MFS family permease